MTLDPILQKLQDRERYPSYVDPRHCLVMWARPPASLRSLVSTIQLKLRDTAPSLSPVVGRLAQLIVQDLWLMPLSCLHMTTLEITHSLTEAEIGQLIAVMNSKIPDITDFTHNHRARLIKPMISYDGAAVALSFVPAAGEGLLMSRNIEADAYTYHHLRRDLYQMSESTGVAIASRYTVPSSHLTIARFVTTRDFSKNGSESVPDPARMAKWIERIEETNIWLESEYWPREDQITKGGGEWIVGEENGLDCRRGTLWYGGGETVRLGKGFHSSSTA